MRDLGPGIRYRADFDKEHGRILRFTVQLEVALEETWRPVRRYDTAHGFVHCDLYRRDGSVQRHQPLPVSDYNEALTMATEIVRENGIELAREFLENNP